MSGGGLGALFMLAETLGMTVRELLNSGLSSLEFVMWMQYLSMKGEVREAAARHPNLDMESLMEYVRALED